MLISIFRLRALGKILKKPIEDRKPEDVKLIEDSSALVKMAEKRIERSSLAKERCQEVEDLPGDFKTKCKRLASIIKKAKQLLVYTGAGISTAAQIPDYRGSNGVWTQLKKTGKLDSNCDLTLAGKASYNLSSWCFL